MDRARRRLPPMTALRPFEAAVRLGGFTRAAEELHLTQAAVSHQIRNLEQDLGCALFERRNRMVVPTQAGRAFARTVAEALDGVGTHAERLRDDWRAGEVILYCELCEAMYWVMPRLGAFRQAMPDIHVNVVTSTRPLAEFDGDFDVALQTAGRAAGALRPTFTVEDEVFPICGPAFLAEHRGAISRDGLADLPLLHFRDEADDWLDWDGWFSRVGSDRRVGRRGMIFDDYLFMIQATIEGRGLMLGWRRTMERLIAAGALVRPVPETVSMSDGLSVYCRPMDRARPETETVLTWMREELDAQAPLALSNLAEP